MLFADTNLNSETLRRVSSYQLRSWRERREGSETKENASKGIFKRRLMGYRHVFDIV